MEYQRHRSENPIIHTTIGNVRGQLTRSVFNQVYYTFDGIPYAKKIVRERRFRSPEPINFVFPNTIDCTKEPEPCMQLYPPDTPCGSEDCLYLNICTKQIQPLAKFPVIVFLHGGAFTIGNGLRRTLGPDYFMLKSVVFISIGFRLGAFGFISFKHQNVRAPGNAGIKDVILALRFINKNIAAFNGDPGNVTLLGHNTGSAIAQLLMQTNQCKGLFHKAILMAGFYLDTCNLPNAEHRLATCLGSQRAWEMDDEDLYDFISLSTAEQLVRAEILSVEDSYRGYVYGYMPNVETYVSPTTVIVVEPVDKLATAWGNNIPVIIGHTAFEGLQRARLTAEVNLIQQRPDFLLPFVMQTRLDYEMKMKMVDRLLRIHLPNPPEICKKNITQILDMQSHNLVVHPLHRFLSARRHYGAAPTYLYRFDFYSEEFNANEYTPFRDVTGINHGEEIKYLFYRKAYPVKDPLSKEAITIQRMIDMWTEFAKRSSPNAESIRPTRWKPVKKEGVPKCLNIGEHLSVIDYPEYEKNLEWDKCFREAGIKLF